MCTELFDPKSGARADTPRELAALIGAENIVWHDGYAGLPSIEDPLWADACLCPVDVDASMRRVGGEYHGYGDNGYAEFTLPPAPNGE